jgi:hypothetical protein
MLIMAGRGLLSPHETAPIAREPIRYSPRRHR